MSTKSIQSNVTTTAISVIIEAIKLISYATMIFSSACPDYFATGLSLFFLAGFVAMLLLALFSSYEGIIGNVQDVPAAVAGLIAISLAGMLSNPNQEAIFSNLFIAIALSSILTGVCFILLGRFKLGNMVRLIPYPVMGGFLAGTGWLLFKYGLVVSTGTAFNLADIGNFISQVDPAKVVCCFVVGCGIMVLRNRYPSNRFIMPGIILGSITVFWIAVTGLSLPVDQMTEQGWLLGPMPEGALWQSISFPDLTLLEWPVLLKQFASISTIIVLSCISFLLNESGIELASGKDLNVNKDLYVTGTTNVINSFLGVPSSYLSVSSTVLVTNIGAARRSVGIMSAGGLLLLLFAGGEVLSLFPKFVAGGLLFFLGISMLKEWLCDCRKSIPKVDYCIIIGIVLIVEFAGFLQGIAFGIIAAVVIFIFRYSSINIIKNALDGTHIRSNKDRSITDQWILDHQSDQLMVLQLQGFIFFGTANSLYEKVKQMALATEKQAAFFIIDLKLVQGIDSSAIKSFVKLAHYLDKKGTELILVNMMNQLRITFEAGGFSKDNHTMLSEYSDLDHATEYCEDQIIKSENAKLEQAKQQGGGVDSDFIQAVYSDMMAALEIQVLFEDLIARMEPYLEMIDVVEGDTLYKENEDSKDIYFIILGQVTLSRTNREGNIKRIRTLGPWTITGELGAFLGYHAPYRADVVKKGVVQKLSSDNRIRMGKDSPDLAAELQHLIIIMLGNQLMKTNSVVDSIGE